jgi:hypothetical protein
MQYLWFRLEIADLGTNLTYSCNGMKETLNKGKTSGLP